MKRNIVSTVLLMFFTCGLYYLYLIYQLSKEINEITNDNKNNPLIDLVLSICTCGIYPVYWFYKISRQIEEYEDALAMRRNSIALLTTILALLPYGCIISMAIVQTEVNNILNEKIYF